MSSALADDLTRFYRDYYGDALHDLAAVYPDRRSLPIAFHDLYQFDADLADDYLHRPEQVRDQLQEALRLVDIPVDVTLADADAPLVDLPESNTHYPGELSPTDDAGDYVAIEGEISRASDVVGRYTEAAFECRRCGTLSRIPQRDRELQEPHECEGCERQGPFRIVPDQSEAIDAQRLRIQTPPEVAAGAGVELDVDCERYLCEQATVGDRVTIHGILHRVAKTDGQQRTAEFDLVLEATHIAVHQTDHTDVEVDADARERIRELASGVEGDPLDLAAASLAPKIYGLEHIKRMAILLMVGGERVVYGEDGAAATDTDRGDFHMLLIGDPGTAKSKLVERVEEVAPRSVGVSGKGSREAGITASAVRDDFGDSEWTLKAGAFVKANDGVVAIDELDDMNPDVRASMLEPMSKQSIHVNKAGITAHLSTRAGVIAAANPMYGRFDPYDPIPEQFDLESTLLSRFDLIYTLTDRPDADRDERVADHILAARDAAKDQMRDAEADNEAIQQPVDPDLLRQWIALAKRQPAPTFASQDIKERLQESFTDLRAVNGYEDDSPVPVTFRKLEAVVRIAEAAAKFELSDQIEQRHAEIAMDAVGQSIRDVGKDDEGRLDSDIQETGTSHSQKQKYDLVETAYNDLAREHDGSVPLDALQDHLADDLDPETVASVIGAAKRDGIAIEDSSDTIRWLGKHR